VRLRLPELLKERGVTAYAVARDSGGRLAIRSLYRLVKRRGRVTMVSAKTIEALCDVLRASPNELIELEGRRRGGK
jgi:DNA-binding Xre family transcriptional regulator